MSARMPYVAGMFYPAEEDSCRREIEVYLQAVDPAGLVGPVFGGLAPHAGWTYSGATMAQLYATLADEDAPDTVVLLGAAHQWGMGGAILYGSGAWRTPLGDVPVDEALAREVLEAAGELAVDRPEMHAGEHSIEVHLPFVRYIYPQAMILPVIVMPFGEASRLGRLLAGATRSLERRVVVIASSDLTHYGPRYRFTPVGVGRQALEWTRQNDLRLLNLLIEMQADRMLDEVREHQNACGAGAVAAAIACAAELGATQGVLLHHTTSYDVMPMGPPEDMVGYAAVAMV